MRPSLLFCTAALASTLGLGCSEPAPTDPSAPAAAEPSSLKKASAPTPQLLVTGFQELQGSTVGPGGALFVTAPLTGRIWRVDPKTGAVTLFASGLPARIPDFFFIGSGVVDVAFLDGTAYALVTGVGPDLEGHDIVGIYRMDGPNSFTVVADLGAFSLANPPVPDFFVPTGFQYAIESFRGGFLVTDGHHNRVLSVSRDGEITELIAFGNVVPTGHRRLGELDLRRPGRTHPPPPGGWQGSRVRSRSRPPPRWSQPAPRCSSTWSSAAGAHSSPSRRASGTARSRGLRRCRIPARWCR